MIQSFSFIKSTLFISVLILQLSLSACGGGTISVDEEGNVVITPNDQESNTPIEEPSDDEETGKDEEPNPLPTPTPTPTPTPSIEWELNSEQSRLNFVTTKKLHAVESHTFGSLDGLVDSEGLAVLQIDLNSVDTNVALRDQRMRDIFFETFTYPIAEAVTQIDLGSLEALNVGQQRVQALDVNLNLHGITTTLSTSLVFQRLDSRTALVRTNKPVVIDALDFGFAQGLAELKSLANLSSISSAVPVDLFLIFNTAAVQE